MQTPKAPPTQDELAAFAEQVAEIVEPSTPKLRVFATRHDARAAAIADGHRMSNWLTAEPHMSDASASCRCMSCGRTLHDIPSHVGGLAVQEPCRKPKPQEMDADLARSVVALHGVFRSRMFDMYGASWETQLGPEECRQAALEWIHAVQQAARRRS